MSKEISLWSKAMPYILTSEHLSEKFQGRNDRTIEFPTWLGQTYSSKFMISLCTFNDLIRWYYINSFFRDIVLSIRWNGQLQTWKLLTLLCTNRHRYLMHSELKNLQTYFTQLSKCKWRVIQSTKLDENIPDAIVNNKFFIWNWKWSDKSKLELKLPQDALLLVNFG